MDVDAVIRRAPELALVDELAHTNAPGMRNAKRYQDIDEILDAGIDVISTVNIQHLESLNDTVLELTGVRVRETFPDRILDEADEVVLVDLAPEALQERLRAGQGLQARPRRRRAVELLPARQPGRAARAGAARGGRGRGGAARDRRCSTRSATRPWPSGCSCWSRPPRAPSGCCGGPGARRSGWAPSSTCCGCGRPGAELTEEEAAPLAALRRLVVILGGHFLEEECATWSTTVRRVAAERGTTYVFLGTPDERRRIEILRGSLVSALVRELPGIDIRIVANRADRASRTP